METGQITCARCGAGMQFDNERSFGQQLFCVVCEAGRIANNEGNT